MNYMKKINNQKPDGKVNNWSFALKSNMFLTIGLALNLLSLLADLSTRFFKIYEIHDISKWILYACLLMAVISSLFLIISIVRKEFRPGLSYCILLFNVTQFWMTLEKLTLLN